eukprot:scaffold220579_cov33-Prasinocladus_malaysianus.AAC.1
MVSWFTARKNDFSLKLNAMRLRELKGSVTGIEDVKLKKHLEYCQEVAGKAELMAQKARKDSSAADKKFTSQRLALESQKMEAEVRQPC